MKRLSVCFAAVTLLILLAGCGAAGMDAPGSSVDAENVPAGQYEFVRRKKTVPVPQSIL